MFATTAAVSSSSTKSISRDGICISSIASSTRLPTSPPSSATASWRRRPTASGPCSAAADLAPSAKAQLSDGTAVGVKRIGSEERGEKAFKFEVAAIASVQHVNLVRLLGYCIASTGPRFLVYDFVFNGSLDNWISPKLGQIRRACSGERARLQEAVSVLPENRGGQVDRG